ncbi:MAG TPA: ATP-binding protein [Mycobacteriales bacterium]|nr:ATP-binding protein [Mycobacteriales bacterium]
MTDLVAAGPDTDRAEPPPPPAARPRPRREPAPTRAWSLRRSLTVLAVVATVLAVAMIALGALALTSLQDARSRVVDKIDPAYRQAEQLQVALVNQETGVRGYALGRRDVYLLPWTEGRAAEAAATRALTAVADDPDLRLRTELTEVGVRTTAWRTQYAEPILAQVRSGAAVTADPELGRQLFDQLRLSFAALQRALDRAAADARSDLDDAAARLSTVAVLIGVALVALLFVLAFGLRRVVERPLSRLAGDVRQVADGDFEAQLHGTGPREIVGLGADVEAMRRQIVTEFTALRDARDRLDQKTQELERSNTELEQFAYVASHDLQEPLRKVASFTQLLERRYKGQLDERADQYIAFAVDGAKRMQVLINDLLSFSRVGRLTREHVEIGADTLVEQALANLSLAIEDAGATVTVAPDLPRVSVDQALMVGVFQNLIGNALKFRGDDPPRIAVGLADGGTEWEFSIADNGIGIEPEYADRIFVIFQRLHPKDAYPGTGIGLAMCRKIIEYHGGRIWLDTSVPTGTTFRFTLPKLAADLPVGTTDAGTTGTETDPEIDTDNDAEPS